MLFSITSYPEWVKKTVVRQHHCRILPLCANCYHQYSRACDKGFKTHTASCKKAIEWQNKLRTCFTIHTVSHITVFSLRRETTWAFCCCSHHYLPSYYFCSKEQDKSHNKGTPRTARTKASPTSLEEACSYPTTDCCSLRATMFY